MFVGKARWREISSPLPDGSFIAPKAGTATVKEMGEVFGVAAGEAAQKLYDSMQSCYALKGGLGEPFTWERGKVRFCIDVEHGQYVLRMDAMEAPDGDTLPVPLR